MNNIKETYNELKSPLQLMEKVQEVEQKLLNIPPEERIEMINNLLDYCRDAFRMEYILKILQEKTVREIVSSVTNKRQRNDSTENKFSVAGIEWVMQETGMAKQTIYGYVYSKKIPHIKKGKRLLFYKHEIRAWIQEGRVKTETELEEQAFQRISRKSHSII